MTNSDLLRKAVEKSGYKKSYIAKRIGLTYQGYLNKECGKSEFRQSEIEEICKLLDLTTEEKEAIFFATEVA
jgi:DNA-binding XRE family transcriptional regulator